MGPLLCGQFRPRRRVRVEADQVGESRPGGARQAQGRPAGRPYGRAMINNRVSVAEDYIDSGRDDESPVRSLSAPAGRPTTRRPARCSPLAAPQDTPGRGAHEAVCRFGDLGQRPVHSLRHPVRSVTGHVLSQGSAVRLAARSLHPPRQPFHLLKHLIRDGYRSFHTGSIIGRIGHRLQSVNMS
jgi:hypothetical protein